jgi:hypothetical protein
MADLLLRDSDVMSMRHSLELRVPFVDRPLVEWLWRQPPALKFGVPVEKNALRRALADLLPPALLSRPKRGFSLPFPVWMRRELRPFLEDAFSAANVKHTGLFETAQVQHFWRNFLRRQDSREWSRVWSLAMLLQFARQPAHHFRARHASLADPQPLRGSREPTSLGPAPGSWPHPRPDGTGDLRLRGRHSPHSSNLPEGPVGNRRQ